MSVAKLHGLVLLCCLVGYAQAQPLAPVAADNTVDVARNLLFAEYESQSLRLDLYRPTQPSQALPVVIVIREGGWPHGDKETGGALASALARRGLAAASIEYRGASEAVFPAYINDTKAAVRWLRANAQAYNLNPDAIGAMGGSWGGYLAAYSAMTNGLAELEGEGGASESSSHLSAVVGISAPLHLPAFGEAMERFLGESLEENPELWSFASATTHVSKDSPPLLLIASQADTTVPYGQALMMAQAYGDAGSEIELHLLPQVGHAAFWHHSSWLHDRAAAFFHRNLSSK